MSGGKTYAELILDLENKLKRQANLEGWSSEKRELVRQRLDKIRKTLGGHLDQVPSTAKQPTPAPPPPPKSIEPDTFEKGA